MDFLLCLKYRELWSVHQTTGNKAQAEVFFLLHLDLLRSDDAADDSLYLRDKPDKDCGIDDVERGMESCKDKRQLDNVGWSGASSRITHYATDEINEVTEDAKHPYHAEDIEEHMCESGAACLRIGCKGCHIRRYGGADILSHHKCDTEIDRQYSSRA